MKTFPAILFMFLPLVIAQVVWSAEMSESESVVDMATVTPIDTSAAILSGALDISADGRKVVYIRTSGEVVVLDPSTMKTAELILAGEGKPSAVSISKDGAMVAIGYVDSRLVIKSLGSQKILHEFHGHSGEISALSFSLDGKFLASGSSDATTQLWDMVTGKRLHVFDSMYYGDISFSSGIPVSVDFSSDDQVLIVNEWYQGHYDVGRGTTLWDLKNGFEISTRAVASPNSDEVVRSGQALGGKAWLLAYTGDWLGGEKEPGLMVERLDRCDAPDQMSSGGYADTVAADPLGRWVAAVSEKEITFFGIGSNKKGYDFTLPAKMIALVPHPDGRSMFAIAKTAAGGNLYRIMVPTVFWQREPISIEKGVTHCAPTAKVRMQQDFKVPASPSPLVTIATLMPTKAMKAEYNNNYNQPVGNGYPSDLYFSPYGSLFALYKENDDTDVYSNTGVAEWDIKTQKPIKERFRSNVDEYLIMGFKGGWVEAKHELINLLTGKPVSSTSISDSSGTLYYSVVFDSETGHVFQRREKHIEHYAADGERLSDIEIKGNVASFTAKNGRLAVLYKDGGIQVFQLGLGSKSTTYKLNGRDVEWEWPSEPKLTADGKFLQLIFENGSGDGPDEHITFHLNSALKTIEPISYGQLISPFPGHANRGVVADTRPHRLAVWDYDKGEIVARLPRHRSRGKDGEHQPLKAALTDDGRLLASASYDGLVRVWDIDAHKMIGQGRASREVSAIVFDSTGRRLAVGSRNGQIVVFQVEVPK